MLCSREHTAGRGQSLLCPCEPTPLSLLCPCEPTPLSLLCGWERHPERLCLFGCSQDESITFLRSPEVVQGQRRKKKGQEGLFCVLGLVPLHEGDSDAGCSGWTDAFAPSGAGRGSALAQPVCPPCRASCWRRGSSGAVAAGGAGSGGAAAAGRVPVPGIPVPAVRSGALPGGGGAALAFCYPETRRLEVFLKCSLQHRAGDTDGAALPSARRAGSVSLCQHSAPGTAPCPSRPLPAAGTAPLQREERGWQGSSAWTPGPG